MEVLTFNVDKDRRNLTNDVQNFDIDFKNSPSWVQARQYENQMRQVQVNVQHGDGTPFDLTGANPLLEGFMPDGVHRIIDAKHGVMIDPVNGQFRFDFPAPVFAVSGSYKQIFFRLYRAGKNIATLEFSMEVLADKVISGIVPSDYITPFEDLYGQLEDIINHASGDLKAALTAWQTKLQDLFDSLSKTGKDTADALMQVQAGLTTLEAQIKSDGLMTQEDLINALTPLNQLIGNINDFKGSGSSLVEKINREFTDRGLNVKWFGAVGGGTIDDTAALQSTIDYAHQQALKIGGIVKVIIPFKIGISGTINLSSNVILTGSGSIKCLTASSLSTPVLEIAASSENCGITDIEFDMNHLAGCLLRVGEDVKNLSLKNMKIKDCYDSDSTTEQVIIFLETGISGLIDSIDFKLIKKLGNNVTTDGAGRGSCIKTSKYGSVNFNPYDLTIKNVSFEDCYNVNAEGEPIIEDFDCIYLFHEDVPGSVRVKNINAKNINKRVIKIQASGVDVDGVYAKCDENISCQWVISVFYNNNSVRNVFAEGNFTTAIEFLNATNSVAENITLESTITGTDDTFAAINIFNSSGITVNGLFGRAVGGLVIFGPVINRLTINNVDLQVNQTILRIEDRTIDNAAEKNCILSNITFDNVKIVQTSGNTVRPSVRLYQANEGGQIKYINFNNVYITFDQEYQWGLFALKSISNLHAYDVTLINKTGNTNNALAISYNSYDLYFTDLKIKNDSYALQIGDDSTVEIFRGNIGTILMTGANTKLDLGRLKHQVITYQSGAIETNVKEW